MARDSNWALGYAITVHSSQGLTIADPKKVWIIHDYLQWSNLSQLERVVCPLEEGSEGVTPLQSNMQQLRKAITKKLVDHKRQDQAK
ncbi:MAG: hypothetical protein AB2556_26680 [Candidatus Thiodiazotropha sp.]